MHVLPTSKSRAVALGLSAVDMRCFILTTAQRAAVRHGPLQVRQTKQALNQPRGLARRQAQQAFDARQNWMAASENVGWRPR